VSINAVIGLDIGGANVKAARLDGQSASISFPLWKEPQRLHEVIRRLASDLGGCTRAAITMTGELADCFRDRAAGVRHILEQTEAALPRARLQVFTTDRSWADPEQLRAAPDRAAAANWLALAIWVARQPELAHPTLLVDCGSTTTDFVMLEHGTVATDSQTDFDRLCRGELVYVGIGRTPVCAVCQALPFRGTVVPVMNELFATADDVALMLGWATEAPLDLDSADGCPRTMEAARNRMARMIGLDHRSVSNEDARQMALAVADAIRQRMAQAMQRVLLRHPSPQGCVISGHGRSLVENVLPCVPKKSLAELSGGDVDRVGPAFAVAALAIQDGVL
jgi:hypothetical protein